jgi:hypothetical protein
VRKITCLGLLLALTALCQSQGPRSAALDSLDALVAKEVSSNGVGESRLAWWLAPTWYGQRATERPT